MDIGQFITALAGSDVTLGGVALVVIVGLFVLLARDQRADREAIRSERALQQSHIDLIKDANRSRDTQTEMMRGLKELFEQERAVSAESAKASTEQAKTLRELTTRVTQGNEGYQSVASVLDVLHKAMLSTQGGMEGLVEIYMARNTALADHVTHVDAMLADAAGRSTGRDEQLRGLMEKLIAHHEQFTPEIIQRLDKLIMRLITPLEETKEGTGK